MDQNKDAPTVVRRRRKVARQQREQTPEAPNILKYKYSDDESSSTNDYASKIPIHQNTVPLSGHRSKILGRRDKTIALIRSTSSPREAMKIEDNSEILALMKQSKRSLSSPRQKEDLSSESDGPRPSLPIRNHREKIPIREAEYSSSDTSNSKEISKLQINLLKFEAERRRFEEEKQKFEKEKRDLSKIRLKKLEEFDKKRIFSGYTQSKIGEKNKVTISSSEEDKIKLIENFNEAQQVSTEPIQIIKEDKKLTDYESSTESCSSSDVDEDYSTSKESGKILLEEPFKSLERNEAVDIKLVSEKKKSWFSKLFGCNKNKKEVKKVEKPVKELIKNPSLLRFIFIDSFKLWRQFIRDNAVEYDKIIQKRNCCIADTILIIIFCGLGGMFFRFSEGSFENQYKCGVRRVKRDFVDQLWISSHNLREDDWKSIARHRLRKFEDELNVAFEAGVTSYSGQKAWTFINGIIYCITVVTTIGYGHISPSTNTGRAVTIVYAIIGIPLFLILLADFGKLLTRCIKFVWAFVRRLYYTGSCRKVRKHSQMQAVMGGINAAYEIATFRRPSMFIREAELAAADIEGGKKDYKLGPSISSPIIQQETPTLLAPPQSDCDTPTTPMPDPIEIDDEFNLPISLALFILIAYILIGALLYTFWEQWTFFESFYFVFISMSTIGFGDYVPQHPIFMMASIIYLVFGLALTSMCINVVQVKLSDSFRQATAKIGATIGFNMAESEQLNSENQTPVDLASLHTVASTPRPEYHIGIAPPLPPKPLSPLVRRQENDKNSKKDKKSKKSKK